MARFCREHGLPHDICGKLVVATTPAELPRLENLLQRGRQNGVPLERLTPEQARVLGLGALLLLAPDELGSIGAAFAILLISIGLTWGASRLLDW